jgi:hypothetical protein
MDSFALASDVGKGKVASATTDTLPAGLKVIGNQQTSSHVTHALASSTTLPACTGIVSVPMCHLSHGGTFGRKSISE